MSLFTNPAPQRFGLVSQHEPNGAAVVALDLFGTRLGCSWQRKTAWSRDLDLAINLPEFSSEQIVEPYSDAEVDQIIKRLFLDGD